MAAPASANAAPSIRATMATGRAASSLRDGFEARTLRARALVEQTVARRGREPGPRLNLASGMAFALQGKLAKV